MEGWIKIHRKITHHWIWSNEKYLKCWIWFLIRANHKPEKVLIDTELFDLQPGEFITSIKKISEATKLTYQNVRTLLRLLENDKMLNKVSNNRLTKITLCNYDDYQLTQQTDNKLTNKPTTRSQHAANNQPTTDKNVIRMIKNDKEEINTENFKIENYETQLNAICKFFEISEQSNFNAWRNANQFLTTINHRGQLEHFTNQLKYYIDFKTKSNQHIHGIKTFFGDGKHLFENGAWNAENWQKKYTDYINAQPKGTATPKYKRNQIYHD